MYYLKFILKLKFFIYYYLYCASQISSSVYNTHVIYLIKNKQ